MVDVTQTAEAAHLTIADVELTGDHLLIQPLAIPERAGRFYIPETAGNRERPQRGIVIACGPGQWNEAGTARRAMTVPVGALAFFGKYSGVDQAVNGIPYLLMSEDEVLMFLPADRFTVVTHEDSRTNHLAGDYCAICDGPDKQAILERAREDVRAVIDDLKEQGIITTASGD